MKPTILILGIFIVFSIIIPNINSNKIQKSGSDSKDSSNEYQIKISKLEKEIAELKYKLQSCQSNDKIYSSSFLELKSDPAFKTMINFPLPRDTSYIGVPGEKNNQKFGHIKLCTPGCIVGGG